MKLRWLFCVGTLLICCRAVLGDTVTVDFEDRSLAPGSFHDDGSFTSHGASFNNSNSFGYWEGWSYSNLTNIDTTLSVGENNYDDPNEMSAYNFPNGGGSGDAGNYAVAFAGSFLLPEPPTIVLPAGYRPVSLQVTNNLYATISMLLGDGFAKKFGGASGNDADFFKLTISGLNGNTLIDTYDFLLADYTFSDNSQDYIVKTWSTITLPASFATVNKLAFTFSSSDVGLNGVNTPTYVALDNLVLTAVPEPGAASSFIVGMGVMCFRKRRFKKR